MAKKVIQMTLSEKSIQNAIKQLRDYQNSLEYKCNLVAQKMAEKGVEIAKAQVYDMDAVFTTELFNSIHPEYKGQADGSSIWAVIAGTDHAVFVEFGTGVIGQEQSYPGKLPDGVSWQYASGKTIRQLADGRYGWFYPGSDGNWYFTEGMPSRPFMLNTSLELYRIAKSVVKEVFGQW